MTAGPVRYFARDALLPGGPARDVLFEIDHGRYVSVRPRSQPTGAALLPGVALPGLVNSHSHAFHRALRGRTAGAAGSFWSWRERMYAVADALDPDSLLALARATYAEMACAGITEVAEFHYLHHGPGGRPYDEPNVLAAALHQAALEAGIRLVVLDTCYLTGGLGPSGHLPVAGAQRRFADASVDAWAARVSALAPAPGLRVGVAVHSVRAVPRAAVGTVAAVAGGRPLHAHLSEQPAENEACQAFYGCSPTEMLAGEGALGPASTLVHATHLTGADVSLLAASGAAVCLCPTTERDLADGIGPARALADAGVPLSLGSDGQTVIDMLEEARGLEMHERLTSLRRGRFAQSELLCALTSQTALPGAGGGGPAGDGGGGPAGDGGAAGPVGLVAGARADLVAVRTDTPRTAGVPAEQILLSASAADVDTVLVDGQVVVSGGRHRLGDVGTLLAAAIDPLWAGM